jgi:hypothetical protein
MYKISSRKLQRATTGLLPAPSKYAGGHGLGKEQIARLNKRSKLWKKQVDLSDKLEAILGDPCLNMTSSQFKAIRAKLDEFAKAIALKKKSRLLEELEKLLSDIAKPLT